MTIKEARNQVGLTQKQLSEWLNIPKRTIENWDSGVRTPAPWLSDLLVEKILTYNKNDIK